MSEKIYPPLAGPAILLFFILVMLMTFMFPFIAIAAFRSTGIPGWGGLLILWSSLLGSFINIPVKKIRTGRLVHEWGVVYFFGIPYYVPRVREESMTIAVNVGGAVIPSILSLYMLARMPFIGGVNVVAKALVATTVVALVTYKASKIIEGVGIAVPSFVPALTAALTSLVLVWEDPASTAYVSGTLGTLIGADILNMPKIKEVKAPVISIGGAGTFDGVFLSGLFALILVAILR